MPSKPTNWHAHVLAALIAVPVIITLAILLGLLNCGPLGSASPSLWDETVASEQFYTDVQEVPSRYRVAELPIAGSVWLLFSSSGHFCSVSGWDFNRAQTGQLWACHWRVARGERSLLPPAGAERHSVVGPARGG